MQFQWYPGHMTKAKRMMQENIQLIDLIIELVDARIPMSSRNPDIDQLGKQKSRLILLNKADLADPAANDKWATYFEEKGFQVVAINSRSGKGMQEIQKAISAACREKIERDRRRGILNRPVRAMVAGIPNVGKSTFINSFAGKACAKTGNKPGVTKGKQWIRLNKSVELLDTPGILWPKFDDQNIGMRLAFIGSMNDEILNIEELTTHLIRFLQENYPHVLENKYHLSETSIDELTSNLMKEEQTEMDFLSEVQILQKIAKNRGCLKSGNELDLLKASKMLLDDFRSGRLGRITLELPENQ